MEATLFVLRSLTNSQWVTSGLGKSPMAVPIGTGYTVPMGTGSRRQRVTAGSASPSPAAEDLVVRDEEILRAAFDVFTEKGFHGATMLDVAKRAHASKATLYARYANKEALFEALVEWGTRQGTDALDRIAEDTRLEPLEMLRAFAAELLALMLQPRKLALCRIAVAEGERLPNVGRIYSRFTREHGVKLGRKIASALAREGLIEIGDADEFGHSFIGLLQGELYMRALLGTSAPLRDQAIESHARRAISRLVRAFAPASRQAMDQD